MCLSGLWYPSALSEILKKTLHEQGVAFTVAPYSALGQVRPMVSLHKQR